MKRSHAGPEELRSLISSLDGQDFVSILYPVVGPVIEIVWTVHMCRNATRNMNAKAVMIANKVKSKDDGFVEDPLTLTGHEQFAAMLLAVELGLSGRFWQEDKSPILVHDSAHCVSCASEQAVSCYHRTDSCSLEYFQNIDLAL